MLVVFLLPHNPALSTLPLAARDMTDDNSFRKLERSVRGCADWYFWHLCSSRGQEERLKAFNMPACDTILSEVRHSTPQLLALLTLLAPGTGSAQGWPCMLTSPRAQLRLPALIDSVSE